jgi:hypothetical protein
MNNMSSADFCQMVHLLQSTPVPESDEGDEVVVMDSGAALRERLRGAGTSDDVSSGEQGGDEAEGDSKRGTDTVDVRTLWIDYDEHQERHKRWRDVARESKSYTFGDWPFDDSYSAAIFMIRHWDRHSGDPLAWLDRWFREKSVSRGERTGIEMTCLVNTMYLAGAYDQLNGPALASLETVCRRIAQIVEAYQNGTGKPQWSGLKHYIGQTDPMDFVDPQLRACVARKNKEDLDLVQLHVKNAKADGAPRTGADAGGADELAGLPKGGVKGKTGAKVRQRGLAGAAGDA